MTMTCAEIKKMTMIYLLPREKVCERKNMKRRKPAYDGRVLPRTRLPYATPPRSTEVICPFVRSNRYRTSRGNRTATSKTIAAQKWLGYAARCLPYCSTVTLLGAWWFCRRIAAICYRRSWRLPPGGWWPRNTAHCMYSSFCW